MKKIDVIAKFLHNFGVYIKEVEMKWKILAINIKLNFSKNRK